MTTALRRRSIPTGTASTPAAGPIAQARLAADAAAVLQWLRIITDGCGPEKVSAALDALNVLRTDLRSLRPILDKDWAVQVRGGLDMVAETLVALALVDSEIRLLDECGAAGPALALLEHLEARRAELACAVGPAVDAVTRTRLELLATGRPAPLRTEAPTTGAGTSGDAHLPAAFVLPGMLHRRWRKVVKDAATDDLVTLHRRAAKLLAVAELAAHGDVHVPAVTRAGGDLLAAAAAALRVSAADRLRELLPPCATRKQLTRVAKGAAWAARGVEKAMAELAGLGGLLTTDAPAKVAGGGLVVRHGAAEPEVLVVHRVRHDDWSIPKGAALPGETALECATREVREETGLRCRPGQEIRSVTYQDRNKRDKHVRYWHMTPLGTVGVPDSAEIDETRWVPLSHAASVLSRKRDRAVLDAFRREHGPIGSLVA